MYDYGLDGSTCVDNTASGRTPFCALYTAGVCSRCHSRAHDLQSSSVWYASGSLSSPPIHLDYVLSKAANGSVSCVPYPQNYLGYPSDLSLVVLDSNNISLQATSTCSGGKIL